MNSLSVGINRVQIAKIGASNKRSVRCYASQPGDKILPIIRTPFDLLALGPRLGLGYAMSISETLAQLPADVERISALISDPRSLEEKQAEILEEIEGRVVTYVEKGMVVENDIISNIPEPVKEALPPQIKDILKPRDLSGFTSSYNNGNGSSAVNTWTVSSVDEEDGTAFTYTTGGMMETSDDDEAMPTPSVTAANQLAAELVDIQSAVMLVRQQLSALQTNTDSSKTSMLKLNLREAASGLGGRLNEIKPNSRVADASVNAAVEEAEQLLTEVEALM